MSIPQRQLGNTDIKVGAGESKSAQCLLDDS